MKIGDKIIHFVKESMPNRNRFAQNQWYGIILDINNQLAKVELEHNGKKQIKLVNIRNLKHVESWQEQESNPREHQD